MACLLQSCGYILPDPILRERKRDQIGKYVIDMERTEWGEYEAEKKRKANKKRQKDTDARWVKQRGLQHPDKPGLQPVPLRASNATWNELDNYM